VSWSTRAAWYGYPTPATMRYWTVELVEDSPHVVAEGVV